jgi:predicted dehydrogenase
VSEDYTKAALFFQVKKAVRYIGLYGLSRTLAKVRGQYHLRAVASFDGPSWVNIGCKDPDVPARNIAIIGCGNYAFSVIAYYLKKHDPQFLRATYDVQRSRALSLCKAYRGAKAVGEWRDILWDPQVRMVFIASNHASHAEYAVECIEAGKHVHIEKPHVVSDEQLNRLLTAMKQYPRSKVFLGFNRPRSWLFGQLQKVLALQSGPLMINWAVVGHEIPDGHWYLDEKEGGRILGNLCHWTDLTLHLVSLEKAFPCTIIPATPKGERSDCVVSLIFADRSCASITFSAKGHTFEGVREILNLHRGDIVANLTDFQMLTMDMVEKKWKVRSRHRDHGHEANIIHSFAGAVTNDVPGETEEYIAATAKVFLAIRRATDSGEKVVVSWEDIIHQAA